jgi:DNA-binding FrmR family transcriptional regulator
MAVRPASRSGGLTGVHYGLIAFVFVAVLALVGFIVQLTQNAKLFDQAEAARTKLAAFGDPQGYYLEEARNPTRRSTVFALMNGDLQEAAKLVSGASNAVWPGVRLQVEKAIAAAAGTHGDLIAPGDSLIGAVSKLSGRLSDELQRVSDLTGELKTAQGQLTALEAKVEEQRKTFEEAVTQLTTAKEAADKLHAEQLAAKDAQLKDREEKLSRTEQELQALRTTVERGSQAKDIQIAELQRQLDDLAKQLRELQPPSIDPARILTKADGKIIRAIPGSEIVYINLGKLDGIKVGMGFEVFSTVEAPREARGKASLEVVTVGENMAECRVTRSTEGQPIVENDSVVNIIYERGKQPRFVVRGEFDLDYNGTPDSGGAAKIEGLIRQWGGIVVADLDETVEYVVIGTAPQTPVIPGGEPLTPVVRAQLEAKALANTQFQDLIKRAETLHIPVVTQSQFLFLTGFSQ